MRSPGDGRETLGNATPVTTRSSATGSPGSQFGRHWYCHFGDGVGAFVEMFGEGVVAVAAPGIANAASATIAAGIESRERTERSDSLPWIIRRTSSRSGMTIASGTGNS